MKKKIYKIALVLLLTPTIQIFNSCNNAIDIIQDGEINDEAVFTSVENMKSYLLSVYNSVDVSNEIYFTSIFTDEVGNGAGYNGSDASLHRFYLSSNESTVSNIWLSHNRSIDRVNRFLRGAEMITPEASEEAEYQDAIAQAKVLRAYNYLQLEAFFSTDMKDETALGVIYSDKVQEISAKPQRSTNAEIYKLIEEDLSFADKYLDPQYSYSSISPYMVVNENLVNSIRARFYLYTGDYEKAKIYAQKVIDESGLSLTEATPLVPSNITATIGSSTWNTNYYGNASGTVESVNPYRKMWADKDQGEVIFALSRPANGDYGNIAGLFATNRTTNTGAIIWDMGRNLFNIINETDVKSIGGNLLSGDIRRYAYIDPSSKISKSYLEDVNFKVTDNLVIDKYPGKIGTSYLLRNDIKIFRLSEMYFILAECAVQDSNLSLASDYINKVRKARYFNSVPAKVDYANQKEAYADILKERRVELCFEGHRYIDLKRLGELAGAAIDRNITDDIITSMPTTIPYDYRFTLPIPLNEIQGNPNIQQNPGY